MRVLAVKRMTQREKDLDSFKRNNGDTDDCISDGKSRSFIYA